MRENKLKRHSKIIVSILLLISISSIMIYLFYPLSLISKIGDISSEDVSYVDIYITPKPGSKEEPYSVKNIKDKRFINDILSTLSNQKMRKELFQSTQGYDRPYIFVAFALHDGSFTNINLNQGYRIKIKDTRYVLHGDGIDVNRLEQQALQYQGQFSQ